MSVLNVINNIQLRRIRMSKGPLKLADLRSGRSDYEDDMQKAIDILEDIVKNQDAITDDYAAGFNGFGDFSLNIVFIYYVRPESHWLDTQTLVNKEILKRFNKEGLEFAFPTQTILKKDI